MAARDLDRGARANPWSVQPHVTAGTMAMALGETPMRAITDPTFDSCAIYKAAGGTDGVPMIGVGSLVTILGVFTLGPVLVRPVMRIIGAPTRLFGITGTYARENAIRDVPYTFALNAESSATIDSRSASAAVSNGVCV